jgi:hypothetical protein
VLVRLIRALDPAGRPNVRIGGQSTDHSWWPVPGMRQPPGVVYSLGPSWASSALALAQALDADLVLGVNLDADRPRIDQVEARQFLSRIGRRWIRALTIGNEPPLYSVVPYYRVLGGQVLPWYEHVGQPVFGRGPSWSPTDFDREYQRVLAVLPNLPIAGPDTSDPTWFPSFAQFLSPSSRLRILTSHAYGLNNCVKTLTSPAYPTVPNLLRPYALRLLYKIRSYVALAHANHATFRIDEMGSITCNGREGVSNTFASALWLAAALFTVVQDGVDGVNLHSYPGLPNDLFDFTHGPSGWRAQVKPMFYGALMFARAAPAGR